MGCRSVMIGKDGIPLDERPSVPIEVEVWITHPEKGEPYLQFSHTRSARGIFTELSARLKPLIDEYLSPSCRYNGQALDDAMPRNIRWLCSAVPGGSEGHYVHIDMEYVHKDKPYGDGEKRRVTFALAKTFQGWDHAWEIAKAAAEALGA